MTKIHKTAGAASLVGLVCMAALIALIIVAAAAN
jgi:hypothetical protein